MFNRHTATGLHNPVAGSAATNLTCSDPSRANQSQKAQADINTIVRQFGLTGKLPILPNLPEYGDFTDAPRDYREALEKITLAETGFMTLPADVRANFHNSPAEFFDAVHNADEAQLREWGVLPPAQDTQAAIAPPATPPEA